MAMPIDPRMRSSALDAKRKGIGLSQAPGEYQGSGINYGAALPYGHMGAPIQPKPGSMAMGPAGAAHPGPGMTYPVSVSMPASPFSPGPTQPPVAPASQSPFAVSPATASPMDNTQAAAAYKSTGIMPKQTVGGRFGPPQGPLPFEKQPRRAVPLGEFPKNQTEFDTQMAQQNPGGVHFGGTLPTMGTSFGGQRRPMFASEPMRDFGPQKKMKIGDSPGSNTKYYQNENGQIERGGNFTKEDKAKADAALGLAQSPARQGYLQSQRDKAGGRQSNVTAQAQVRSEARRERMGRITPDEMLARMDPQAAAQKKIGEGQLGLAKSQSEQTNAFRQAQLAQQKELSLANNAAAQKRAEIAAGAKNQAEAPRVVNTPPLKTAPKLPPEVHQEVREAAAGGDITKAKEALAQQGITDKHEQNKILSEATGQPNAGLGFWDKPAFGANTPGTHMTRGDAAKHIAGKVWDAITGSGGRAVKDAKRREAQKASSK